MRVVRLFYSCSHIEAALSTLRPSQPGIPAFGGGTQAPPPRSGRRVENTPSLPQHVDIQGGRPGAGRRAVNEVGGTGNDAKPWIIYGGNDNIRLAVGVEI